MREYYTDPAAISVVEWMEYSQIIMLQRFPSMHVVNHPLASAILLIYIHLRQFRTLSFVFLHLFKMIMRHSPKSNNDNIRSGLRGALCSILTFQISRSPPHKCSISATPTAAGPFCSATTYRSSSGKQKAKPIRSQIGVSPSSRLISGSQVGRPFRCGA